VRGELRASQDPSEVNGLSSALKTPWSDRIEDCREQFSSQRNEKIRQEIVEKLGDGAVLEIGCGTQELEKHLGNRRYVGVDLTPEFKPHVLADAHHLPFRDNSFSNVCTKNCLQHTEDYQQALREVVRVARDTVVLAERVHDAPTKVVFVNENGVIRRRFNASDLIRPLREFGGVKFNLSEADDRVGIVCSIKRS